MSCCDLAAVEGQFTATIAERDLKQYRRRGVRGTTRLILALLSEARIDDATLLDVGGGIGVLLHELLDDGVTTAVEVEPASAYIAVARAEADRRGHAARVRFVHGALRSVEADLAPAHVVTLDRVVCCDSDAELVSLAARKSRRFVALSLPRERWYVRCAIGLENTVRRLQGNPFRAFVHSIAYIEQQLESAGFARTAVRRTLVWHVALYERRTVSPGGAGDRFGVE